MDQPGHQPWEYRLRKYLLLLATLVVTVTYAAGFNPPGGNWQEGAHDGRLAGDPIIRDTYYHRYLAFFYCNATAFAASLVVIVLILILAVQHDKQGKDKENAIWVASEVKPLRAVMVLDLLSIVGAYGTRTCRDKISTVYSAVLVATVFIYIVVLKLMDRWSSGSGDEMPVEEKEAHKKMKAEERLHKVLMLLATFAVSITYVAGLSTRLLGQHRGQPPPGRRNPQGAPQPAPDGVFYSATPRHSWRPCSSARCSSSMARSSARKRIGLSSSTRASSPRWSV